MLVRSRVLVVGLFLGLAAASLLGQPRSPVLVAGERSGNLGAAGQSDASGSIVGVVRDPAGAALPGVTVSVTRAQQPPLVQVTTATGAYEFPTIAPGTYTVSFELTGFKKVTRPNVIITPGFRAVIDQRMELSQMSRELTVNAATPVVDTKKTTTGGTFTRQVGNYDSFQQIDRTPWRPRPSDTSSYAHLQPNRFELTTEQPVSTFGADVDTASYTNVRRFLNDGRLPPADAVRLEEFVNYFRFDYPAPAAGRPVGITAETGVCPWARDHRLVLIGARAQAVEPAGPRNLVFLIDVSGSMAPQARLPLIKTALRMFVDTLRPDDTISIVTYAGYSGVALQPTTARDRDRIHDAIAALAAGGSTNGGAGLMQAYTLAHRQYVPGGVNRIILATDGDFNVGVVGPLDLLHLVERERQTGVFLSVLGVGDDNYKDSTMEMLADKGNGHYAYLDSLDEARRVVIREADSTLQTVAKDVKFQVEFNPATVRAWRLLGYEDRVMAREDFNNDRKDGGELGAGHTVTVLYEIVPAGASLPEAVEASERPSVDPLIYQSERVGPAPAHRDDWLTVKVRYKQPEGLDSVLMSEAVKPGGSIRHLPFAADVAEFAMLLRDDRAPVARWDDLVSRLHARVAPDASGEHAGFTHVVELAAGLRRLR